MSLSHWRINKLIRIVAPIYYNTAPSVITIFNSKGEVMLKKELPTGNNKLDLSNYAAGVYFLKAGGEKITIVRK
ncbi:MAG: T9SS type A sorting domain-containing protein [Chitinophagaceae bacterium]